MKKLITSVSGLLSLFIPVLVNAQALIDINSVAGKATNIGNLIVQLAISLAVVWIIVNVVRYLIATNDPAHRTSAGWGILWGVVGLFVILSVWGLVYILRNSFRTQDNIPQNQINNLRLPAPPVVPN